ncbi:MAG TPA: DUF4124 domain-containing protein [Steroidobacteraceae bacterium]|jgi:hypothetical protein|nr:DUF4124 domain-containing protein [Steroidobacteraceae bacterium]
MRGLPLLILLGACTGAWAATVYKWVDDNGVVHFSDQPNPKAQKIEVAGAQTYGAPPPAAAPPAAAPAPATAPPVCVIDTPAAGQVFLETYAITGHVTLAHAGEGSQTMLRLDGADISGSLGPGGGFALGQVERGEHTLTLQVTNDHGEVSCQGAPVSFSVRQRSAAGGDTAPMAPTVPGAPKAPGVGVPH